jgi:hypothetical protein
MDTPVTIILSIEQLEYIKNALLVHQCSNAYAPKHNSKCVEIGGQLMEDIHELVLEVKESVNNNFPIYYLVD